MPSPGASEVLDISGNGKGVNLSLAINPVGTIGVLFSPILLTGAQINNAYLQNIEFSAGIAPYTASILAGVLPIGLALSTIDGDTARISGVPTTAITSPFIMMVTDAVGNVGLHSYNVFVAAFPNIPSFLTNPSIITDGSPTVGEIIALSFGTAVNDTIGVKQLIRNNGTIIATLTTGSIAITEAGLQRLKVTLNTNTGIIAYSDYINPVVAISADLSPPTLSFDTGYVTTSNPPEYMVSSLDDTIDVTTDSYVGQSDRLASGTFTPDAALGFTVPLNLTQVTAGEFLIALPAYASAGAARFRGYFTRPAIGLEAAKQSAMSNVISATLNAPALPTATTTFDPSYTSSIALAGSPSNGNRDYQGVDDGTYRQSMSTTVRTTTKFVEFLVISEHFNLFNGEIDVGVCPDGVSAPNINLAAGSVAKRLFDSIYNDNLVAGVKIVMDVTWKVGAVNGVITFYRNGVSIYTVANTLTSGKFFIAPSRSMKWQVNAGQDTLTFIPPGRVLADRWG